MVKLFTLVVFLQEERLRAGFNSYFVMNDYKVDRHNHAPKNLNHVFAIGFGLNITFVITEAFYGWKINSLALLADAGHNLSDVLGLLLAWSAVLVSNLRHNNRHTYGWRQLIILANGTQ